MIRLVNLARNLRIFWKETIIRTHNRRRLLLDRRGLGSHFLYRPMFSEEEGGSGSELARAREVVGRDGGVVCRQAGREVICEASPHRFRSCTICGSQNSQADGATSKAKARPCISECVPIDGDGAPSGAHRRKQGQASGERPRSPPGAKSANNNFTRRPSSSSHEDTVKIVQSSTSPNWMRKSACTMRRNARASDVVVVVHQKQTARLLRAPFLPGASSTSTSRN